MCSGIVRIPEHFAALPMRADARRFNALRTKKRLPLHRIGSRLRFVSLSVR